MSDGAGTVKGRGGPAALPAVHVSRPYKRLSDTERCAFMQQLNRQARQAELMLALCLLEADGGDGAWLGWKRLAMKTGYAPGTVRNAIAGLLKRGAFVAHRRAGLGNLKVYYAVPINSWVRVTSSGDMNSMSPNSVTPGPLCTEAVSSPASPFTSHHGVLSSHEKDNEEAVAGAGGRAPHDARATSAPSPEVAELLRRAETAKTFDERTFYFRKAAESAATAERGRAVAS